MALVTIGSLGHSPGTTTTAVAMTLRWPGPALLVEADTSRTSAVLPGRLRGQVPHRVGLTALASAALHGELSQRLVRANAIPLADDRWCIPGFSTLGAARGAASFWRDLAAMLHDVDGGDTDVIVDLGRVDAVDDRALLAAGAHLAIVATGAALPDVAATTAPVDARTTRLRALAELLAASGRPDALRLVVIERHVESYSAAEIRHVTGIPMLGAVPVDDVAAATYSLGAPAPRRRRNGGAYERAIDALVSDAQRCIAAQRDRLEAPRNTEVGAA